MKPRADGRWQKKITLPNGKTRLLYSTAKTERSAIADFNKQILYIEKDLVNKNTFSSVANHWADETFERLENNSLKSYKPALRECIEYFGDRMIQDITPSDVKNFVASYERKGFAKKTIKTKLSVLNLIMKFAIIEQKITSNPCQLITITQTQKREKRKAIEEVDKKKVIEHQDCKGGFLALFLLYTGLRRGEAFALTPEDIDYNNKTVKVSKTVEWIGNKPQIKNCPKTDAGNREVPLPDILIPKLSKRKNNNYIFENAQGELMHNSQVTRMWNKYREVSGIEATPHMLRHTYATMLFDAGIDVKTAQVWLGHTDIKTTLDIYTHLSSKRKEASLKKWEDYISKEMST